MGAYENPRIITPPDYGQIFRTNFIAGQQLVQSAIDRREAKIAKEKAEKQAIADKQLAFNLQAGEIKAGDLTGALQNLAYNEANSFSENEAKWANDEITFEEYTASRNKSFRMLQELKQTGLILEKQSKSFDNFERSSFQHNPELLALSDAWKNRAIIPEYIDGELFLNYKVGEENHTASIESFKDGSFFDMVEKYNIGEETMKSLNSDAEIKKKKITNTEYDAAGNIISEGKENYVENESVYIDRIKNGPRMKDLLSNVDDAGSIWADDISKTTDENKLNIILNSIADKNNITGKEREAFLNSAKNGVYANGLIKDAEGKSLNYRELVNEASAQVLAERSFKNYLPSNLKLSGGGTSFTEAKPEGPTNPKNEDERRRFGYSRIIEQLPKNSTPIQLLNRVNQSSDFSAKFGYKTGKQLTTIGTKDAVLNYLDDLKPSHENYGDRNKVRQELEKYDNNVVFDLNDLDDKMILNKLNSKDTLAKIFEESPMFKKNDGMYIRDYMTAFEFGKNTINGKDYSKPKNSTNPKMGRYTR